MYELTIDDIKKILSDYNTIKEQTRQQIIELYNDLFDTDTLIDTIAVKTKRIDAIPSFDNIKTDLSDIVLRHERLLKKRYKDISYEIDLLLAKEEMLHRLWICYRLLPEIEYQIITNIYINKKTYKSVESESGETKSTFLRTVNRGLKNIKHMYDSNFSNDYLLKQSLRKKAVKKKPDPPKKATYEQLSFCFDENANYGDKKP